MCGVIPAVVMLLAAPALGARTAELVRYAHSGEVSGDDDRVVGLRRASRSVRSAARPGRPW